MRTINDIEIDTFTEHYLTAALWASTDNSNDQGGEPLDANYDLDDLSALAVSQAKEDCECFQKDNATWLARAGTVEQNGHDFWLTRNRHGAGFWDRGYRPEVSKALTDAAHVWGSVDLYIGDDGLIHSA